MSTSKLIIKLLRPMVIGLIISGCKPECSSVENQIQITDWEGAIPKHGVLYRYKKGSNFSVLEQKSEAGFRTEIFRPEKKYPPDLEIVFTEYGNNISTESDYKLVLDNKIEYRIYRLESDFWDDCCQLSDGMVNQCEVGTTLAFSKECGIPVKQ